MHSSYSAFSIMFKNGNTSVTRNKMVPETDYYWRISPFCMSSSMLMLLFYFKCLHHLWMSPFWYFALSDNRGRPRKVAVSAPVVRDTSDQQDSDDALSLDVDTDEDMVRACVCDLYSPCLTMLDLKLISAHAMLSVCCLFSVYVTCKNIGRWYCPFTGVM